MRKSTTCTLFLIQAFLPLIALASDQFDRVLQLPFGKPLDRVIPHCSITAKAETDYCGLGRGYKKGKATTNVSIMLMPPPSNSQFAVPSWVASDVVHVDFDSQGSVKRIMVWTKGPSIQDEVIASISSRFGSPSDLQPVTKQNAFGAKVLCKKAFWALPSITVYHDCPELDRCAVVFSVPTSPEKNRLKQPAMP